VQLPPLPLDKTVTRMRDLLYQMGLTSVDPPALGGAGLRLGRRPEGAIPADHHIFKAHCRSACARDRRPIRSEEHMARLKKSIKSRSKEKVKALKRKRIRRKKSLRKGKRGK
jgi:hypothetical protein